MFVALAPTTACSATRLRHRRELAEGGASGRVPHYEQGGHGFGMYQKETTSTGWFDAWVSWLRMHGYLSRAK